MRRPRRPRIADAIGVEFGAGSVIRDVPVAAGEDFRGATARALASCDAVLAIVGPKWSSGLDDPLGFNLPELETALRERTLVLPVLVGGAKMPSAADLPPSLVEMTRRQAIRVVSGRAWESDLDFLFGVIRRLPAAPPELPRDPGPEEVRLWPGTPDETVGTVDLARVLARAVAARWTAHADDDAATPESVVVSLATGDEPLCRWFAETAGPKRFAAFRGSTTPLPRLSEPKAVRVSRDLSTTLDAARITVDFTGSPAMDVKHLVAAFIYSPTDRQHLPLALVDAPGWSIAFLREMARSGVGGRELAAWKQMHRGAFPTAPIPMLDTEGPSAHIATDVWTIQDALGYADYARAIAAFMTHKRTEAPLTIGIQAPWGGGKTSLMRMIQRTLDPEPAQKHPDERAKPRGVLTVTNVLRELQRWVRVGPEEKERLPAPDVADGKRLTIWFNAWKYESSDQVWAGLAYAIIEGVTGRMGVADRERFWLRLNLRRIDVDTVRQRVHERITRMWWRAAQRILLATVVLVSTFLTVILAGAPGIGLAGTTISLMGAAAVVARQWASARRAVEAEPADSLLADLLDAPDYAKHLGFVHQVEADIHRVLDSIPPSYKPLVIFIDDLDRCSPTKVAQVVEAVNLFMAGDFPDCMFVLGMDAEMVAAALQAAHSEMTACPPAEMGIPVGWRFMDKFIQLPFVLPPPGRRVLFNYTAALAGGSSGEDWLRGREIGSGVAGGSRRPQSGGEGSNSSVPPSVVGSRSERYARAVDTFSDENPEVRRLINDAASLFSRNPREIKRFVNAFRFQYFLWKTDESHEVTLDQLQRWALLSMRWPEVVRWVWRGDDRTWREDGEGSPTRSRLILLEQAAAGTSALDDWMRTCEKVGLGAASWVADDDLRRFFLNESGLLLEERVSSGSGKGLW